MSLWIIMTLLLLWSDFDEVIFVEVIFVEAEVVLKIVDIKQKWQQNENIKMKIEKQKLKKWSWKIEKLKNWKIEKLKNEIWHESKNI